LRKRRLERNEKEESNNYNQNLTPGATPIPTPIIAPRFKEHANGIRMIIEDHSKEENLIETNLNGNPVSKMNSSKQINGDSNEQGEAAKG
jgi:hypothetical protein